MLQLLISIFGVILTIFFVIGTHEYGHFLAARLCGVKVLRFSIGFGKTLFKWRGRRGTQFVFALVPLGGYVKMVDENEETVAPQDLPYAFNRQPFYKKFFIVLAGPIVNILCAFVLYWLIFVIGFTTLKPMIGDVQRGSIADQAGLKPQQEIVSIDHKPTFTWTNVIFRLLAHVGNVDQAAIEVKDALNKNQNRILNLQNWQLDALNPDPLKSLGIVPYVPNIPLIIGIIAANSPAMSAHLNVGDKIIAINHEPIKTWEQLLKVVKQQPDQKVVLTIERQGKVQEFPIIIGAKQNLLLQKTGYLGIAPQFSWPKNFQHKVKYSPIAAIPQAWQELYDFTYVNFLLIGKMIIGKLSLQGLGGPITIFESAGNAINYGLTAFISFLAFLSISIGIINLLPIPGLDGGHLVIQIIELIIRKPLPIKVLINLYRIGFLILFLIILQALLNDILRMT